MKTSTILSSVVLARVRLFNIFLLVILISNIEISDIDFILFGTRLYFTMCLIKELARQVFLGVDATIKLQQFTTDWLG